MMIIRLDECIATSALGETRPHICDAQSPLRTATRAGGWEVPVRSSSIRHSGMLLNYTSHVHRKPHQCSSFQAIRAQREMHTIQHKRGISFAGAWLKYGFHEDGFTSGLRAAAALLSEADGDLERLPFKIDDADRTPGATTSLASLFDVLEWTGLRAAIGACLCLCLVAVSTALRLSGVDCVI